MMQMHAEARSVPPSTFVTVIAWIFIILSGFTTLVAAYQNVMLYTMVPFNQMPIYAPGTENIPSFLRFVSEHVHLFVLSFLILSALTLAAAIGLFRRKNWARLVIVGILAFGIAWNLGGIALQQTMMSSMVDLSNAPAQHRAEIEQMLSNMMMIITALSVGFSLLFAWIIKRLTSKAVRVEFNQA